MNNSLYNNVKTHCGFYHHKELGILEARGNDVLDFLNRTTTNELLSISNTQTKQTVLTTDKGRIIDLVTVSALDKSYLILTSYNAMNAVVQHMRKYIIMDDVRLHDARNGWSAIEILGPQSTHLISLLLNKQRDVLPLLSHTSHSLEQCEGSPLVHCIRMPSVCEMSYFLLFKCEYEIILNELLRVEPSLSDVPAELYEILRVESGFPLFGNELNEQHNPLEANLLHLVNFKKGCYIGQEVIARLDSYNKVKQRLMGFKSPLSIPVGCELVAEGNVIGEITSSAVSPMFGNIALGYIRTDFANNGRYVIARNDKLEFELLISSLPFHND